MPYWSFDTASSLHPFLFLAMIWYHFKKECSLPCEDFSIMTVRFGMCIQISKMVMSAILRTNILRLSSNWANILAIELLLTVLTEVETICRVNVEAAKSNWFALWSTVKEQGFNPKRIVNKNLATGMLSLNGHCGLRERKTLLMKRNWRKLIRVLMNLSWTAMPVIPCAGHMNGWVYLVLYLWFKILSLRLVIFHFGLSNSWRSARGCYIMHCCMQACGNELLGEDNCATLFLMSSCTEYGFE